MINRTNQAVLGVGPRADAVMLADIAIMSSTYAQRPVVARKFFGVRERMD